MPLTSIKKEGRFEKSPEEAKESLKRIADDLDPRAKTVRVNIVITEKFNPAI